MKPRLSRLSALLTGVIAVVVLIGFLLHFGKIPWFAPERRVDLSGSWQVVLPAGFVKTMTIVSLGGDMYSMKPLNFAGKYELRGNRLEITEPVDARLTEFAWELQADDSLILVEGPPVAKTGADYTGAVLRRQIGRPNPRSR